MTKEEVLFHEIAASIPDSQEGKMFGALCIKAPNGKAGVMFWKNQMIFKLDPGHEQEALQLSGAKIFAPMDNRPMNGWVQLAEEHAAKWQEYAVLAMSFVKQIEVPDKPKKVKKSK